MCGASVLAFLAAMLYLGPSLGSGPLLNLDLVIPPTIAVPPGMWGLGPELPRRVPLGSLQAWVSMLIGGPATMKLFFFGLLLVGFVGMARLLRDAGPPWLGLVAASIYTCNPFVATRLSVGHWNVLAAWAVLPIAIPRLLQPSGNTARTFLAAAALGVTGFVGGTFAVLAVVVGLVAERGRRFVPVVVALVAGQLPWLVPGLAVLATATARPAPSLAFKTRVGGLGGLGQLVLGEGFWRRSSDLGRHGPFAIFVGCALLGMAVLGHSRLGWWRARLAWLAGLGALLVVSSDVVGLRQLNEALTSTVLSPLREGQRAYAVTLLWLAPAAALGVRRAYEARGRVASTVAATALVGGMLVVTSPGLWGAGGRLRPVHYPSGWAASRRLVRSRPGPVLALPWHQFFDIGFAHGRRVLNPLPDYFGGDVLSSSDPELGPSVQEVGDRREGRADALVRQIVAGAHASAGLRKLGVRWIVLAKEVDWTSYRGLRDDSGLDYAYRSATIDVLRVRGWSGPIRDDSGAISAPTPLIQPLELLDRSGRGTWYRPPATGWLRGLRAVRPNGDGLMMVPAGRGPLWYWPAVLVGLGDLLTGVAVAMTARSLFSHQHSVTVR